MSDNSTISLDQSESTRPTRWRGWARQYGSGIALAVTSVGAGDMVTSLSGAEAYGMGLVWIVVLGLGVKWAITEAVGRLQLGSDRTLLGNMARGGPWLPALVLCTVIIVALPFGAGLSVVSAFALVALVPGLPLAPTAIVVGVIAGIFVLVNRQRRFEQLMLVVSALLVAGMSALAVALLTTADDSSTITDTAALSVPEGSAFALFALMGGVGGGIGLSFYGYWLREKKWSGASYLGAIRRDTTLCYIVILAFFLATSLIGTALFYGSGRSLNATDQLAPLADPIAAVAGEGARILFLVVFFLTVFSSILGGFNGFAFLGADAVRVLRGIPESSADAHMAPNTPVFRAFVLFMVATTVIFSLSGSPITLVLLYAATGAVFLPILTGALLWLLNRHVDRSLRNRWLANTVLTLALILYGSLGVIQIFELF